MLVLESNMTVPATFEGWLELNVTGAAIEWMYSTTANLGLLMQVTNERGESVWWFRE